MADNTSDSGNLPKLSQPARRALLGRGITSLEQLTEITEEELRGLHGIGPNAVEALRAALVERGLRFGERKL